jgi:Flp pilus assembly protein TadB
MGQRALQERDLRSLERRSMYSIFHPLDPSERLPRELILEGKRHRLMDIRRLELAGALYLPALMLALVVMGSVGVSPLVAFGVAGLLFAGFLVYVLSSRYR